MDIRAVSFFVFSAPDVGKIPFEIPQHDRSRNPSPSRSTHAALVDQPLPPTPAFCVTSVKCHLIVVIKLVPAVRGNIQILIAVIVVISYRHSHA